MREVEMETTEYRISSYSNIFALGHKALTELFSGTVVVEEKVDGSQISFGRIGSEVFVRSKGKQIVVGAPDSMFKRGVENIVSIADKLTDGYTYRGEYLQSPKHNTLAYSRAPNLSIIIFDVDRGNQDYMTTEEKRAEAARIGLEVVPMLYSGHIESVEQIKSLLPKESILGGAEPEGIVIKNYSRFAADKKILMGKYVRPEFKETNAKNWEKTNPTNNDIIEQLIATYKNEARWHKAIQHLKESGNLDQSPRDIPNIMNEVESDIRKECEQEIKDKLFAWAFHKIARGAKSGIPEWYKNHLLENALNK